LSGHNLCEPRSLSGKPLYLADAERRKGKKQETLPWQIQWDENIKISLGEFLKTAAIREGVVFS
jgi:hypothetical protein